MDEHPVRSKGLDYFTRVVALLHRAIGVLKVASSSGLPSVREKVPCHFGAMAWDKSLR